jgi:putative membrane protein
MALLDPNSKKTENIIKLVSIVIPLAVAGLFGIKIEGVDLSFLPPVYAGINGLTALFLIAALVAIKRKNKNVHRRFIRLSMLLSILFLLCYVAYHITSESTSYEGDSATLYYFILISHIVLSVLVIPIVLYTYKFAWQGNFEKHKKWTRFAWPIWFYVAVTGVLVYWMISPFYSH